jgi:hypothetical protein
MGASLHFSSVLAEMVITLNRPRSDADSFPEVLRKRATPVAENSDSIQLAFSVVLASFF